MKKVILSVLSMLIVLTTYAQVVRDHRKAGAPGKPVKNPVKPVASVNYEVFLYENINYDGRFELVKPGSSGDGNYSLANFNDMVSSVEVPTGMVAVLYEHANEKGGYGNYITLMENCPDLSVYNFNDKISYVTVFPAQRTGFNYVRPRNVNGQIAPGRWERIRTDGRLPDNAGPAIVQYKEAEVTPPKPVVDESLGVFRIQIRIVTGNGENDDTDKEVYVKFNNSDYEYFLDYGPDDFERGSDKKYDILSNAVRKISDLQFIEVGARGDDVWGIKRIELYLNNSAAPVFSKVFPDVQQINGSGNWQRKVSFSSEQIRSNPHWQTIATDANIKNPQPLITAATIKSMVESMVGNMIHYKGEGKILWGDTYMTNTVWGDHVEMKRVDGNTLHFDLDLQAYTAVSNPEVDVDFDLVFECMGSGYIRIKTANEKTSCDFNTPLLQPSCGTIRSVINGVLGWFGLDFWKIEDFNTRANTFNAMFSIGGAGFKCKGVQVTPIADVFIY